MNKRLLELDSEEIISLLGRYKKTFTSVGWFTAVMNLLLLVPSIYMLEVYDRVLTSRNEYTLLMLTLIIAVLYFIYAALDIIRSHAVIEISKKIDAELNQRIYQAISEESLKAQNDYPVSAFHDLTTIRQFVAGPTLYSFFDGPWFPIYLFVIFLFNFWLGVYSLTCVVILIALASINERSTHGMLSDANNCYVRSINLANNNLRQAEMIHAMGMFSAVRNRWYKLHREFLDLQSIASQRASMIGGVIKFSRILMQSGILGLAAFLVLKNEISPGMMIAATIMFGKATAPVEIIIASWRQWRGVVIAYDRLKRILKDNPLHQADMPLERPNGHLNLEGVFAGTPGAKNFILKNISFTLEPGDVLGVIGPSAAGKSTLARILVGVWPSASNPVRLDGADVYRWNKDELGPSIGYIPQEIDLLPGTVSENISRFGELNSENVIEAAKLAGIHEIILAFHEGYDTRIGSGGIGLSAGQKQRIALARALYGNPSLVIMDEPNSNLDEAGERSLIKAILAIKQRKATTILIAHRSKLLESTNKILLLQNGSVHFFGPTGQFVEKLKKINAEREIGIDGSSVVSGSTEGDGL